MVTTNPYLPLPLLPELIARPRRDDDGNFDHVRLHHDVKWGRKSRPIPCRFGGASLSDENGWRESEFREGESGRGGSIEIRVAMGGEGEGGCQGPFRDGCRQVFLPSDDASYSASRCTRGAGEGFFSTSILLSYLPLFFASRYGYVSSNGSVRS